MKEIEKELKEPDQFKITTQKQLYLLYLASFNLIIFILLAFYRTETYNYYPLYYYSGYFGFMIILIILFLFLKIKYNFLIYIFKFYIFSVSLSSNMILIKYSISHNYTYRNLIGNLLLLVSLINLRIGIYVFHKFFSSLIEILVYSLINCAYIIAYYFIMIKSEEIKISDFLTTQIFIIYCLFFPFEVYFSSRIYLEKRRRLLNEVIRFINNTSNFNKRCYLFIKRKMEMELICQTQLDSKKLGIFEEQAFLNIINEYKNHENLNFQEKVNKEIPLKYSMTGGNPITKKNKLNLDIPILLRNSSENFSFIDNIQLKNNFENNSNSVKLVFNNNEADKKVSENNYKFSENMMIENKIKNQKKYENMDEFKINLIKNYTFESIDEGFKTIILEIFAKNPVLEIETFIKNFIIAKDKKNIKLEKIEFIGPFIMKSQENEINSNESTILIILKEIQENSTYYLTTIIDINDWLKFISKTSQCLSPQNVKKEIQFKDDHDKTEKGVLKQSSIASNNRPLSPAKKSKQRNSLFSHMNEPTNELRNFIKKPSKSSNINENGFVVQNIVIEDENEDLNIILNNHDDSFLTKKYEEGLNLPDNFSSFNDQQRVNNIRHHSEIIPPIKNDPHLAAIIHDFKNVVIDFTSSFFFLINSLPEQLKKDFQEDFDNFKGMQEYIIFLIRVITDFVEKNEFFMNTQKFYSKSCDFTKVINLIVKIFNRRLFYDNSMKLSHQFQKNLRISANLKFDEKDLSLISHIYNEEVLMSLLYNLVSNAYKYTDEGEIVIEASIVVNQNKKKYFLIDVRDTGRGIPEKILINWGNAFNMESRETGSGLGQFIISSIAKNYNLRIPKPESVVGAGTVVKVFFPFENSIKLRSESKKSTLVYKKNYENSDPKQCLNILCIDDFPWILNCIENSLKEQLNYSETVMLNIFKGSTLFEFLNEINFLLRNNQIFDMLILDFNLGGEVNGLELANICLNLYQNSLKEFTDSMLKIFFLTEENPKEFFETNTLKYKFLKEENIFSKSKLNEMIRRIKNMIGLSNEVINQF